MQVLGCFIHVIDYEWALFSHSQPHPQRVNNTSAILSSTFLSLTLINCLCIVLTKTDNVQLFKGNPTILLYALTFTWATNLLRLRQRPRLHLVTLLSVFYIRLLKWIQIVDCSNHFRKWSETSPKTFRNIQKPKTPKVHTKKTRYLLFSLTSFLQT